MIDKRFSALTQLSYDELLDERDRVLMEINENLLHQHKDTYLEDYLNALEDLISIKAQAIHYEED